MEIDEKELLNAKNFCELHVKTQITEIERFLEDLKKSEGENIYSYVELFSTRIEKAAQEIKKEVAQREILLKIYEMVV